MKVFAYVVFAFLIPSAGALAEVKPELVKQGKSVYASACANCHHADPARAGALGPEVAGVGKEVLEAKVIRGVYPQGYKPKRATTMMAPMPQLQDKIEALYAYLRDVKKK